MKKFKKGISTPVSMILMAIVLVSVIAIVGILSSPPSLQWALSKVSSSGYVVLASSEYADIVNKLDSISTKADEAVVAAQNAVVAAQNAVNNVNMFNSREVYIFPSNTSTVVLLMSGTTNNFNSWTELKDAMGDSLSTAFATRNGYIDDVYIYGIDPDTQANSTFLLELSYWNGSGYSTLGRLAFHTDIFSSTVSMSQIKSRLVPAGATIYYRMMSTENLSGVLASFRYFYQ